MKAIPNNHKQGCKAFYLIQEFIESGLTKEKVPSNLDHQTIAQDITLKCCEAFGGISVSLPVKSRLQELFEKEKFSWPAVEELFPSFMWPLTVRTLGEVIRDTLMTSYHFTEDKADRLAKQILIELAFYSDGRGFYFPKGEIIKAELRDEKLYSDYLKGTSIGKIARKHKLSGSQAYRIIHLKREENRLK